tara:strand:- start:689 stop:889 length:201 start_codon:yes stop_codon:yes gene_type:complete
MKYCIGIVNFSYFFTLTRKGIRPLDRINDRASSMLLQSIIDRSTYRAILPSFENPIHERTAKLHPE